ncbi:DNA primase [Bacillus sp. M6-12]|nr:DNA primase [Bacillus sp. M6-12]
MDKRQFADEVITSVRSLSITSVLSTRMDLKTRGGYSKGLCPFHNDGKLGSFVGTDSKGIWKCFSCGVGGDTVKFVALHDNINYLEAAFKLGLEYGIISSAQYEEYFERKRYTRDFIVSIERRYTEIDKKRLENEIAEDYVLDKVFRLFIQESRALSRSKHGSILSPEHMEHLKNERNLTEDEIKDGMYFTFPTRWVLKDFSEQLRDRFKDGEFILEKIPGFYYDKTINPKTQREKGFTFAKHSGIGIGIKNSKGQVIGIQIRHDKKNEEKSRYVWFSSSFASYDDKFEFGTSSGSPIDVVYPTVLKNRNIIITEGRFKSQQIAKEVGSIAISVQGVGSWRGIVKELDSIPESSVLKNLLPDREFVINTVLVAFDADMNYKVQVFEQAKKMTDALEKVEDYKYPVYYLNWDENLGKGMDDVLISGNKQAIKRYDKQKWDKQYENMIQDILDKEEYLEIKNVPVEIVQRYYHEHFSQFAPLGKGDFSDKHKKKVQQA